jgi:hypothetical protein
MAGAYTLSLLATIIFFREPIGSDGSEFKVKKLVEEVFN